MAARWKAALVEGGSRAKDAGVRAVGFRKKGRFGGWSKAEKGVKQRRS